MTLPLDRTGRTLPWHELDGRFTEAERVLITSHVRPDGDSLGSALALRELLIEKGKEVEVFNPSPTPPRYWFMDPDHDKVHFLMTGNERPSLDPDLIVIVDTGTWSQLAGMADYVRHSSAPKVVIDHHVSQDDLGALRLVDASAPACGMLIYQAYEQLRGELTPESANYLFIAIAMDTGWMRHSNCDAAVLAVMSRLVEAGARPDLNYRRLFEANRPERLKLLAKMLDRLDLRTEGRLATSHLYWDDILALQAHPMETEDFINHLMSVQGVETAVLFIGQSEGGTKVSFRSHGFLDCSQAAAEFGGGGHKAAAGVSLTAPVDVARERVLGAVERTMNSENGHEAR